jgi:hypothetical protein
VSPRQWKEKESQRKLQRRPKKESAYTLSENNKRETTMSVYDRDPVTRGDLEFEIWKLTYRLIYMFSGAIIILLFVMGAMIHHG